MPREVFDGHLSFVRLPLPSFPTTIRVLPTVITLYLPLRGSSLYGDTNIKKNSSAGIVIFRGKCRILGTRHGLKNRQVGREGEQGGWKGRTQEGRQY